MELEGRKELVDTGKSSRTCNAPTVSLGLAVLNVFQGFLGPKMAVFGPKLQFLKLRSATCESCSRPPPLSFLLLAQPCLSSGFARRVVCVCACVCAVSLCTCRAFLLVTSRP